MGAAIFVLAGMLWVRFGPGSTERTVPYPTLDRIDEGSTTSTAFFLAPRFPTECSASGAGDLTLRVVVETTRLTNVRPGATGELNLRLGRPKAFYNEEP